MAKVTAPKKRRLDMSLTRKLLESLGLEADKVSTIIEAHAETVDALKGQIETYKADAEKYASADKELNTLQTELETLKATGGDWQSKYEAEHKAYEDYKASVDAKETMNTKVNAFKQLLRDTGVSEKRLDSIVKVTDISKYELEDGKIKDADTLAESIKSEWADFITTTETSGANTQTPPANNGSTRFTHEEIAKMSPEEINKNWDTIKLSMKGNE